MNKFFVTLFLLVGSLSAADCDNIEIKSQGDADKFSGCSQAKSITVSGDSIQEVNLESLGQVDTVSVSSTQNLITFNLPSVQKIGTLKVSDNVQLANVDLSRLQNADTLQFWNNPNLNPPKFTNVTSINTIDFTNTAIPTVSGLSISEAGSVTFAGNGNLTSIEFDGLKNLKRYLYIAGNHPTLNAKFPKLSQIGGNCTIANVTKIDLGSLESTGTFLSVAGNTGGNFTFPKLKKVGQSLSFVGNPNIKSINIPNLETVAGSLFVANNTALESMEFPKLKTISGALDVIGSFDSIKLPAIELISGTWNIQSKSDKLNCDTVRDNVQKAVKGSKTSPGCKNSVADPQNVTDGKDGSNSGNNGFQLSMSGSLTMASVLLAALFM